MICLITLFAVMMAATSAPLVEAREPRGSCYRPDKTYKPEVLTAQPHTYLKPSDIPRDHDWRNINGTNYCTPSRNQHIPTYCGSCWAMSSTSAFADRIRIARRNKWPDFMIAAQEAVYCLCQGCGGGDASTVYAYMKQNGIAVDSCQNYIAQGNGNECTAENRCMDCAPAGNCSAVHGYPRFFASEHGSVVGVDAIKAEVFARGPVACYVDALPIYDWGFDPANKKKIFSGCAASSTSNSGSSFASSTGGACNSIDHVISVVGFGYDAEQGMDYWVIRNSWGEYWGDNGYFRLKMGDDQIGLEGAGCAWAVPIIPPSLL